MLQKTQNVISAETTIELFMASVKDPGPTFNAKDTIFEGCNAGITGFATFKTPSGAVLTIPVKTSRGGKTVYTGVAGAKIQPFFGGDPIGLKSQNSWIVKATLTKN